MNEIDYQELLKKCSTDSGPQQSLLSALSIHDKRQIVQFQAERGWPVLSACVTYDLKKWVRQQGYSPGYTNKNRTAKYWIKRDNPMHSRVMIKDVPVGMKSSDGPGSAMKACGRQLISILDQSGLSQSKFAKRTGIPQPILSDLKNEKASFTVNTLEAYFRQAGYKINGFILEKLPTVELVSETKRRAHQQSALPAPATESDQ